MTRKSILALFLSLMILFGLFTPVMTTAAEQATEEIFMEETAGETEEIASETQGSQAETQISAAEIVEPEEIEIPTETDAEIIETEPQSQPETEGEPIYAELLGDNPYNIRLIRGREVEDGSYRGAMRDGTVTITKYK